jgi:hypothetical protein
LSVIARNNVRLVGVACVHDPHRKDFGHEPSSEHIESYDSNNDVGRTYRTALASPASATTYTKHLAVDCPQPYSQTYTEARYHRGR